MLTIARAPQNEPGKTTLLAERETWLAVVAALESNRVTMKHAPVVRDQLGDHATPVVRITVPSDVAAHIMRIAELSG